ncbi:MAG: hypothetical protein WDM91_23785 [Rhizomicrobium sp.]
MVVQTTSEIFNAVANAVITNVVSQGIEVATGLQKSFDWAGVAASGIGGGVGYAVGDWAGSQDFFDGNATLNQVATAVFASTARDIVSAAARTLINGSDFGDNIIAVLPDVLASAVGAGIQSPGGGDAPSDDFGAQQTGKTGDVSNRSGPTMGSSSSLPSTGNSSYGGLAGFVDSILNGTDGQTDTAQVGKDDDLAGFKGFRPAPIEVGDLPAISASGSPSAANPTLTSYTREPEGGRATSSMNADERSAAFDTLLTGMGATKDDNGYHLDGDSITLDNRYLLDKPIFNEATGGNEFDSRTAVYKDTRSEVDAFLQSSEGRGYVIIGALSKLNSNETIFFASAIDSGQAGGIIKVQYRDTEGDDHTYRLPMSQDLEEKVQHEIGHAVYGIKSEIETDTRALGEMGLVTTFPHWIKLPSVTPTVLRPNDLKPSVPILVLPQSATPTLRKPR